MNGFDTHGIAHLSASSLNKFASSPSLWVLNYLFKVWGGSSPAMARGKAVEAGLAHALANPDVTREPCLEIAYALYDREVRGLIGDKVAKERALIEPMLVEAAKALRPYGVPTPVPADAEKGQHRVEITLPGVPVPVIGYLDFLYATDGIVLDLKTTARMPSTMSDDHARQFAVYAHATNYDVRGAYTSQKECRVYKLEDQARHVRALTCIAQALGRFLATSDDRGELAAMLVPNYDAYQWDDPQLRQAAREVYGF